MRHALLALAGIASLAAVVSAAPAAAQSYGYGYGQDPMGRGGYGYGQSFGQGADQGNMEYLDQDSRVQPAPIPRQLVQFDAKYAPGTIVISTEERRLYYVSAPGEAIEYGVGVGRPGFTWRGVQRVSAKKEWPSWTPPAAMLKRRPDLPRYMSGGPENPLGARAMYLGSSEYRIHGSNEPETIGQAVSSGCFRLTNEDVIDLYNRVQVGTTVIVQQ
ncbi:MAG TPA: L,D-transpeptidase [Enterovirga sp.]